MDVWWESSAFKFCCFYAGMYVWVEGVNEVMSIGSVHGGGSGGGGGVLVVQMWM